MKRLIFLVLVLDALIVEALLPRWMLCGGVVMAAWLWWACRQQGELDAGRQGDGDVAAAQAVESGQAGSVAHTTT